MKKSHILFLFVLSFAAACKFPEMKQVQLKRDFQKIQADLNNPGEFESVGITSNTTNTNGVTASSVEINLLNGKNVPSNADSLQLFIKRKAQLLANDITNKADYSNITVNLKTESKSGIISKSTERSFSFSFKELEEVIPAIDSVKNDSININSSDLN